MKVHRLLLLAMVLLACSPKKASTVSNTEEGGTHRDALLDTYHSSRKMLFVYGTGDSLAAQAYRALFAGMGSSGGAMSMVVRSDREVTDAELQSNSIYLIGTPENNRVLKRILPQLPLNVTDHAVEFNQHQYGATAVLTLGFYPNPLAPSMPLNLCTGADEKAVLAHMRQVLGQPYFMYAISSWGYLLEEDGLQKVMGFFDESDPKQWKIGTKTHWDFSDDGLLVQEQANIAYFDHQRTFNPALADSITTEQLRAWGKLQAQFGWKLPAQKMPVHLYPSAEIKGMATGFTEASSLDPGDGSVHIVVHPENAKHENIAGNLWLIRQQLGRAKMPQLELGLSIWPTEHWHIDSWQDWANDFFREGCILTLPEMLDEDIWQHESPYLKGCMSAVLVDLLLRKWGATKFVSFYQSPDKKALLAMADAFQAFDINSRNIRKFRMPKEWPKLQKAFNFAHEGYQVFNGYASNEASHSLQYLATDLHCNAVAVIPYAGYEDVKRPSWLEFSNGAGSENDESIVHCIYSAKQAGMQVMIKPQVWPWNSWTGEIEMSNEADWATFFDHYYRWMRHYAIMADMYEADILCVGVEFSKATLQRPDNWRNMISRLSEIAGCKLTYAANWGAEFEECKFWDALDYIGVNCYYPISKKDKPKQKDLNEGFAAVVDKIERVAQAAKKPVLFTEIGFRSCTTPWANPHAEAEDRAVDVEAQAACYRAMIEGLASRSWCEGIYLWKWPAYMDDARYDPTGFTPLGKPAEALVRDWFGQK